VADSVATSQDWKPSWSDILPAAARVRLVVVVALLIAVYGETAWNHLIHRWMNDGNWSHGWLVPVFSLYLLANRRDYFASVKPRPHFLGAVLLLFSLAVFFVTSWWYPMIYPQIVSIIGSILGLTLLFGGWPVLRVAWFPIVFLLFAMPLPRGLYVELTQGLRALASTLASVIMPLFAPGLYTEAQSVVIDYEFQGRSGHLNVEEACSGMRLLMAFVTLGVAMAYLGARPLWQRIVMVCSCVPIALVCNTIRVTITGLLFVYGMDQWATGTPHQLLGIAMLAAAFGLFALMGYVLNHLIVEESDDNSIDPGAGPVDRGAGPILEES